MIRRALHWPLHHPRQALGLAALAVLLAAAGAARLRLDPSLQNMFWRGDPAAVAMVRILEDFPAAQEFLILATEPGAAPQPQKLRDFAARLEQEISRDPQAGQLVAGVQWRTDEQSRQFIEQVMIPSGVFYLDDAEWAAAQQRLSPDAMAEQLRQDQALLAAPGPAASAIAKTILQDPLHLHEFFVERLAALRPFTGHGSAGEFFSPDGRSLLIRIAGKKPPGDLEFCERFTAALSADAGAANVGGLQLEFSGVYPIAARSHSAIRHDAIASVIGSVAGLALLFAAVFRRGLRLFAVTFGPVALGVLCGLGAFAAVRTAISPLTAVIGAVLAGIGIDYAIFYVVHELELPAPPYAGEREEGVGPRIDTIGSALLAAWVTSVVGFIAVGFASVRILRDFSTVGALGLAGALAGAVWILPALLQILGGRRSSAARFSLRPLLAWIDRRAGICLAVSLALLAGVVGYLALAGPALPLENDPAVLHPRPNAPLDAEADIGLRMGISPQSFLVYLNASSPDELLHVAHQVDACLASPAAREAGVAATFGLASLLPDPQKATQRLAQVGPAYAQRVVSDFDAAVARSIFDPQAFVAYREFLRTLLTPLRPPGIQDLLCFPQLAQVILPRSVLADQTPTQAIALVFVQSPPSEQAVQRLRQLLAGIPQATLTGMSVLSLDTALTIRHDLPRLIAAAVAIIALYLLLHFRSVTLALLAVAPTLVSLLCLLAIARLAGARMNLVNIVSIPLLIGIDTDYGIFLVSIACRRTGRGQLLERCVPSSLAVVLCAASAALGFGSLAFTSVPAVRSLGWAVGIGVIGCALATLFFLFPLLLWIAGKRNEQISMDH